MNDSTIRIGGISGSLRKGSYNLMLLRAEQFLLTRQPHFFIRDIG